MWTIRRPILATWKKDYVVCKNFSFAHAEDVAAISGIAKVVVQRLCAQGIDTEQDSSWTERTQKAEEPNAKLTLAKRLLALIDDGRDGA